MQDITRTVVGNLSRVNRETLDNLLSQERLSYDETTGDPNIEILSDSVRRYFVDTQNNSYSELESEIRRAIVGTILDVRNPDLTYHIQFLKALKKRAGGMPPSTPIITIFTTNYDILFELAAGEVGVRIETGFDGPLSRFFNPTVFNLHRGEISSGGRKTTFEESHKLWINLIKLHGSISWFKKGNATIESGINLLDQCRSREMILPRRQKIMDTLAPPFDSLFTRSSQMLGSICKYLASCGFSFSDQHINDQLIFPKLREGRIQLTALCGETPECLNDLRQFGAFCGAFPDNCYIDGKDTNKGTDLWKFSEFVRLLEP